MDTYVLPHIGSRLITDIKPGEIIDLLKQIWNSKAETARRILHRIDAVFVSAITREPRDKASPCTGVARELGQKRRDKSDHAPLPYSEVASFVKALRQRNGQLTSRLAFEFLILKDDATNLSNVNHDDVLRYDERHSKEAILKRRKVMCWSRRKFLRSVNRQALTP